MYRYFCCENDYSEYKSTFCKTFLVEIISPLNLSGKIKNNVSVVGVVGIFKADRGGYVYKLFIETL